MSQTINVRLNKGEAPSLGFRLQGGKDFGTPLVIQKVNIGSPAEKSGLLAGDSVIRINTTDVYNLRHKDAQDVIIRAGPSFEITVQRGGSTWKPTVTPTSALPTTANSYSPVTKTSLAAKPQPSIGAIGTGHNLAAKPFPAQVNGTVNGGPKFVNKQYNTPVGLYSEQSIAETLSAQAEVLSTGVLGVNFKKNEKNYDASNSAVFRMVQEADKEPRDPEAEPDSGVVSTPIGVAGLRHVSAPEAKAAPATPQLPPGQNICADCERLIVGVFVRIKDKNLHVECFKCSTCGTSLKNVGYYNISNKLYCDVHAKLAAISSASSPNLIPVTVPPGGKAPAGTISAALSSRPLPTVGPISPLSPASNVTAQPFQQQPEVAPSQVPETELDGVSKQDEDHVVKLFKNVTLAASRKKDNANQVFVSEKVIPINNNYIVDPLKAASPIPYTQFVAKASGTFTSNPRPFSSVSSPLSPPLNSYSSLPKSSPVAAPPFSSTPAAPISGRYPTVKPSSSLFKDKRRFVQNIVWPPPPDDSDLPTATPLYFPPPSNVKTPPPPSNRPPTPTQQCARHTADDIYKEELELELEHITAEMDPRMSLCSSEVTSIVDRRSAVEHIETVAETQMFVESILQKRPRSPPPTYEDLKPKVEVTTEPKTPSGRTSSSSNEPRVITSVCVCTNSCCNAGESQLCESCPMRNSPAKLKRPGDYGKPPLAKPKIENTTPRRYGSPQIMGVSVTINNPGKIKESASEFEKITSKKEFTSEFDKITTKKEFASEFDKITTKKSTSALATALAVAPAKPFTPITSSASEPITLPEPTKPYLPPERPPVIIEPKTKPPPKIVPDTPFVSALKIAPDRPYTPIAEPTPVRKKKPEEDPIFKDLPKPTQWMSMITALTTAPDRPYSPLIFESRSVQQAKCKEEVQMQEITKVKETQKEILKRSGPNDFAKPYTKPIIREKYDAVNDKPSEAPMHFPPVSNELKSAFEYRADYSQVKSEISAQIIEQAHLEEETHVEKTVCSKKVEEKAIEKQKEETIVKKPLELSSHLRKTEYLPHYQLSLNYDETIQLPHHKDIKKLLPSDQGKLPPPTKPITTIQPGEVNPRVPQMSFQPVLEDRPSKTTFSPRPGSITPSMINKPAPPLPYYQANLVPTEHLAPEVNLFDPKSPAVSRSPSPCPEARRSPSPFPRHVPRPVSPAAGPPPNPLKDKKVLTFTREDRLREEAKQNIKSYIPQHREMVQQVSGTQQISGSQLISGTQRTRGAQQISEAQQISGTQQISGAQQISRAQQISEAQQISGAQQTSGRAYQECSESFQVTLPLQAGKKQVQKYEAGLCKTEQTVEASAEVSVQIQKCQEIQESSKCMKVTKTCGRAGQCPMDNEKLEPGVVGLHVANPQPIESPFFSREKEQAQAPPMPKQVAPPPPKRHSVPQTQTQALQSVKPTPVSTKATPSPSASANRPPIVPLPHTGSGGGRQAGAIGVAPKRGRGVLNVGGLLGGSRVPLCGHCHSHIRGPFITALGKIWCPEHFICATPSCRRPLQDLGFVEEQGQLYCEYCFEQYLAPPCAKCSSKIKGDCLKAIGKNFHPECFNCSYCGKLFGNSPFFLEDGAPYCENDWNELFTTKCFACGFPVEAGDRWVEALNNNYHSQCFNCTMCKKNLEGQSFFAKGGRPFCKNHAR